MMKRQFRFPQLFKLKKDPVFKTAILYTIGTMMTPAIGLILLPLYTDYLSPAEYGIMTSVQSFIGVLQLFMVLSLHGAVSRLYYDFMNDRNEQKKYVGSILLFVLLLASSISILLFLLKPIIGAVLFKSISLNPFYLYMILQSFFTALTSIPMTLLRVKEKAWLFLSIIFIKNLVILILTLYFIINLNMGVEGPFLAAIIAQAFILVLYFFAIKKDFSLNFSYQYLKKSLQFSLPLLPHAISGWFISASDRVILEKFVPLDSLGLYGLAAQMSLVLGMLYMSINSAFGPRYTKLKKENQHESAKELIKYFGIVIVISGIIVISLSGVILSLLVTEEYYSAHPFLIALLIGQMLYGFNLLSFSHLFYYKKTKSIAKSSIAAAVVNIIVNLVLIPIIGVWGAVWSTLIAEGVRLFTNIYWAKKTSVQEE